MPRARGVRITRYAPLLVAGLVVFLLCGCSDSNRSSGASSPSSTTSRRHRAASRDTSTTAPRDSAPTLGQRYEPSLPGARPEGAAAVAGGRLYVVGGYDAGRKSTNDVFVFDDERWQSGPPLPIALNHPGAAALGGRVYVVGGFTTDGETNRAFVLKRDSRVWQDIAPIHHARGALALVAFAGRLYAIGGRDRSAEIAVPEVYDPRANAWADLAPMPDARDHLAGYVDSGKICVAGGRTPRTSRRIDCFDPATGKWSRSATLPLSTSGAAAAVMNRTTVVAGGERVGETSIVAAVQMLHAGKWQDVPMLAPRHGTAFARYHGRFWVCGGATAPGFAAVATCTSFGR